MSARLPRALATVLVTGAATGAVVLGAASAAGARTVNDTNTGTYTSGDPIQLGTALLYFVGIPLAVFVLVGLFTVGYQRGVGALRYRPGRPWGFGTEWFGHSELNDHATPLISPGGSSGSW